MNQQTVVESFKEASKLFSEGKYKDCLEMYNKILDNSQIQKFYEGLLNRASLYCTMELFDQAIADCKNYLEGNKKQINPQIFVIYLSALVKKGEAQKGREIFKQANEMFPYHKKIADLGKLCKQKVIANDDDAYVEEIFQKLCQHPQVSTYLKQEAFLTKVERMIRNPSLTGALSKLDPRIREAADVMMMADENWH